MDWNAEEKQAAWAFYRERLEQYFVIAGTPQAAKVTHILFYGGKEASERWTDFKVQVDQAKLDDAVTVYKAFANSFKKSSSHWQARDKYLSDIKQTKHQTMAELDIYIKDLIRRCQFPQKEWESCKIDLLYHATAHFLVRKFGHIIEVAQAHERTCQEYQIHKQAHSMTSPSNYSDPLIQTSALSKSFQKGPPKKTYGKWEGHRKDNSDSVASKPTKAEDMEEASSNSDLLPTRNQPKAMDEEENHSRLPPSQIWISSWDQHTLPKWLVWETRL